MTNQRRKFIKQTTAISLGFLALSRCTSEKKNVAYVFKPITLLPDQAGYINLPEGFNYKVISKSGQIMTDGLLVPGRPDGMGVFLNEEGNIVLVRNHENSPLPKVFGPFGNENELLSKIDTNKVYDLGKSINPSLGGTTTLIYDEDSETVIEEYLSLIGTNRNCAGGTTPWGSWLTCEEDMTNKNEVEIERDHGYIFEVPANSKELTMAKPIEAMGRFNHEAVCVDPKSGIVYETEDRHDSLIYRYIPNQKGDLMKGGQLQVLCIKDRKITDTRNWENVTIKLGEQHEVYWMDIDNVTSPEDDLRYRGFEMGAARFARGEGIWFGEGELYFACTNGGPKNFGQVFKYILSPNEGEKNEVDNPGKIELIAQSDDKTILHMCDNLTIAPWGDVILCEDNSELNYIRGINQHGDIYNIACNQSSKSEFAGAVFSPSGKTLFVNIQENGETLAITGPWENLVS